MSNMFPPEIWGMIFEEVDDPIQLIRLQSVSRIWYKIIERILKKSSKWRKACDKGVPYFWKKNILKKKSPECYELNSNEKPLEVENKLVVNEWKNMYISWKKFQKEMKLPREADKSQVNDLLKVSPSERITCTAVQGDILAFSTSDGLIYFCHIYDLTKPFFVADHGQPVTYIGLYTHFGNNTSIDDTRDYAVSNCVNGPIKYWDYKKRREIKSGGNLAQLIDSNFNPGCCLAIWGHVLTRYTCPSSLAIRVWEYELPFNARYEVIAMNFWHKLLLTLDSKTNRTRMHKLENLYSHNPTFTISRTSRRLPNDFAVSRFKKFFILTDSLTACLYDNWLAFSINNRPWFSYNMNVHVGGNVRCLYEVHYATRLMMGLDTGDVYIFTARHQWCWDSYDFANSNPIKLELANEPIISLHSHSCDRYIVATTAKNIHCYEFHFSEGVDCIWSDTDGDTDADEAVENAE